MPTQTPWVKQSLVSDRIPANRPQSTEGFRRQNDKGKAKEALKSPQLKALEELLHKFTARGPRLRDPLDGCFCQAQMHPLSPYVPNCRSCGLVLCNVNLPYFLCPHCSSDLCPDSEASLLVSKLEAEILETSAKEREAREKAIEDTRKAVEAFPTLHGQPNTRPGSGSPNSHISRTPTPTGQQRKVLSLNPQTKRVTVSTYSTTVAPTTQRSDVSKDEPEVLRIKAPQLQTPSHILNLRRWQDPRVEEAIYVPLAVPKEERPAASNRRRKRGNTKLHDTPSV